MHWHALPPRRVTAVRNFVVNTGFSRSAKGSMKTPPTFAVRSDPHYRLNSRIVASNFTSRAHYTYSSRKRSIAIDPTTLLSTCAAAVSVRDNHIAKYNRCRDRC
ncbi:unnamed protein product [Macrosiphum euphorbiae]|uniref:Uncharacterized protein n=1 Tax=Macrosiphum euphorbiae TaxID=13131 RepID=A0AAV0WPN2_9HEMI|nr:unnamed protein product [Macrosiphum euphorbiae]